MHEQIVHVVALGGLVLFSGESCQPFVEQVDSEGIYPCEEHVDA